MARSTERRGRRRPRGRAGPRSEGAQEGRAARDLELRIESLSSDGDGVARAPDGRVVFVPFTAPGDRVLARIERDHARFARARVLELLEPGPGRAVPRCAVFGSCGGCTWQHLDYETQLAAKRARLTDALVRLGGLRMRDEVTVHRSPSAWAYRGRARVLSRDGRVGFRRRRSHVPCATRQCPILVPSLERALGELAASEPACSGEWELAVDVEGRALVTPLPASIDADARSDWRSGSDSLAVRPGVFTQPNVLLRDALATAVHVAAGGGALALELFAGAGFFTLGLARRFARVVAVESDPRAAGDLARNLEQVESVRVLARPVEALLAEGPSEDDRPDVVVADPPRTGLPPGVPAALAALGAPRIVLVSCDPATLARDLALLVEGGYALERIEGFDLFPQTPHVEALAVLERTGSARGAAGHATA